MSGSDVNDVPANNIAFFENPPISEKISNGQDGLEVVKILVKASEQLV